jgi:energy-coupling factor transporter ATP-binding protein EcfA2
MSIKPAPKTAPQEYRKPAKAVMLDHESNEVVFAVVGHVGSGTSEIATALKGLLEEEKLEGGKFDVEILKARNIIAEWATRNGHEPPTTPPNRLDGLHPVRLTAS